MRTTQCKHCCENPAIAEFDFYCLDCYYHPKEWKRPVELSWVYRFKGRSGCECEKDKSGYMRFSGCWLPCSHCRPHAAV